MRSSESRQLRTAEALACAVTPCCGPLVAGCLKRALCRAVDGLVIWQHVERVCALHRGSILNIPKKLRIPRKLFVSARNRCRAAERRSKLSNDSRSVLREVADLRKSNTSLTNLHTLSRHQGLVACELDTKGLYWLEHTDLCPNLPTPICKPLHATRHVGRVAKCRCFQSHMLTD